MSGNDNIVGQVVLWAARLLGLFLIYLLVRHFKPNIFYKGWGNLRTEYGTSAALPAGLMMHHTSLRVGSEHYNQTAYIGLDDVGIYLQRPLATKEGSLLRIPYVRLKLIEPPRQPGSLHLPIYGIFRVNGVDLWIDSPYAEQIINHLPTL